MLVTRRPAREVDGRERFGIPRVGPRLFWTRASSSGRSGGRTNSDDAALLPAYVAAGRERFSAHFQPPPTDEQRAQLAAAREQLLNREGVRETHLDPDTGDNEMTPDVVEGPNDPHAGPPLHQAEADWSKTPRNAPCPCGSGKKYKHCHGSLTGADQQRL